MAHFTSVNMISLDHNYYHFILAAGNDWAYFNNLYTFDVHMVESNKNLMTLHAAG